MTELPVHDRVRRLYGRVNELWLEHRDDLFGGACGFSVLSGAPIERPPVLIIGANPGFGADDNQPCVERTWPARSYIQDAQWPLARKVRAIFAEAGRSSDLDRAVQTNFLFFKSSTIKRADDSRYPWEAVASGVRTKLERWCAREVEELVNVLEPEIVLVLGIAPFDVHAQDARTVLMDRSGRRRLLVAGRIAGRPAIGILHPTGAQVAGEDWSRVAAVLAERLG
ncbi:MAG: hypothetical protein EDM03_15505 [Porphyrobacter sp. IPPAS B-1204]|nr:MAG: hypothetical protein EDM03_15505 [Porphyrobacter sp. IPPAS B-1204]